MEDTLVLGTTQGLATVRDGTVVHCEGLHTPVHLLQHIPSLRLLLLGTGGDGLQSQLVTLHSRPVMSGAGLWSLSPSRTSPGVTSSHAARTLRARYTCAPL